MDRALLWLAGTQRLGRVYLWMAWYPGPLEDPPLTGLSLSYCAKVPRDSPHRQGFWELSLAFLMPSPTLLQPTVSHGLPGSNFLCSVLHMGNRFTTVEGISGQ